MVELQSMATHDAATMDALLDSGGPAPPDVDWASVDQVAALVSRTTLAGMQQLWRQHAAAMDLHGRQFAERMYGLHTQVVKDVANVKEFDLKQVLAKMNGFTAAVRERVLSGFQDIRQQDDAFTQALYQTSRTAFTKNLKAALEARDAWWAEKAKAQKERHERLMSKTRQAAAAELLQRQTQFKITMARTLAKKGALKLDPDAVKAIGGLHGNAGSDHLEGLDALDASLSAEANMLEELYHDAAAADELNRKLEQQMEEARQQLEDCNTKLETLQVQLSERDLEIRKWKSKWATESTKTDSIKRECQAILNKAEEHVQRLQRQHLDELSQRDYVLNRCRETIKNLEMRDAPPEAAAAGAGPPDAPPADWAPG